MADDYETHAKLHTVALVAVGNTLRRDDGIAQAVCAIAMEPVAGRICYLNAGLNCAAIPQFIAGHRSAVIVDATHNGSAVGTITCVDVRRQLSNKTLSLSSTHGISWVDELVLSCHALPGDITFAGFEVADAGWGEGLSEPLAVLVPHLAAWLQDLLASKLVVAYA